MSAEPDATHTVFDAGWSLSASAFNLTPEVVRAEQTGPGLALSLVERGISDAVEVELGQLWRGFPDPPRRLVTDLRTRLSDARGRVSIVGVSIDEWASATRRRTEDERAAFLEPQLRAAAALGAQGVRLPIGQAGPALLQSLLPLLDELDLVLFEEVQGHQSPQHPGTLDAYDTITRLDHPRVRLLLDISMLMPALPETYLDRLARGGLDTALLNRLRTEWRDPETNQAVVDHLRAGLVPPPLRTLYMNLLVRFGRSSVADVVPVIPLISAVHLKFWDLDDTDGRVSTPIRHVGRALRSSGFGGTLCSEWGGLEWLDDDPWETTRAHLALARAALSTPDDDYSTTDR